VNGARVPVALARAGVLLAARVLPTPGDRQRYRAEFLAELRDLAPAEQIRYAAGVLSRSFALRAALGASPSHAVENVVALPIAVPFWRCRVLRLHRWTWHSTDDGQRYQSCASCGEDRGPASVGMTSTPPWPGDI
jgi:hypothetical protein